MSRFLLFLLDPSPASSSAHTLPHHTRFSNPHRIGTCERRTPSLLLPEERPQATSSWFAVRPLQTDIMEFSYIMEF